MRFLGEDQPQMIAQRVTFDPRWGRVLQEDYRGTPNGIAALDLLLSAQGYKTDVVKTPGAHLLTVTYGRDPTDVSGQPEQPVDTWELGADPQTVSIWQHPVITDLFKHLSTAQVSNLIKAIEAAIQAGEDLPALADDVQGLFGPEGLWRLATIYRVMAHGVKNYRGARAVLRRHRTFSGNYAERMVLDTIEKWYSTARLIEVFSIPAVVQAQLPADPTDASMPVPFYWGWVQTAFSSDTSPAINRIEEKREWQFGALPRILFEIG